MPQPLLEARELCCSRQEWIGGRASRFQDVSLEIQPGQSAGFTGPDGCGKGLLLNVLGLLEPPDAGTLLFDGLHPLDLEAVELARLRNQRVGFVFETPNLLPSFTVIENAAMPFFRTRDATPEEARERAREVLEFCGIWRCQGVLAGRISAAEAAAAAVARALMHSPRLIVAINPRCPEVVFPLLAKAAESFGISFLGSGPKEAVVPFTHSTYRMEQGTLF